MVEFRAMIERPLFVRLLSACPIAARHLPHFLSMRVPSMRVPSMHVPSMHVPSMHVPLSHVPLPHVLLLRVPLLRVPSTRAPAFHGSLGVSRSFQQNHWDASSDSGLSE
jgi:hypothetical protein